MIDYRYIIHCAQMPREEVFVSRSAEEFLRIIQSYIQRYGAIDLLYNVGRV